MFFVDIKINYLLAFCLSTVGTKQRHSTAAMIAVAIIPDTTEREPASIRQITEINPIAQRIPLMTFNESIRLRSAFESILAARAPISAENSFLRVLARYAFLIASESFLS